MKLVEIAEIRLLISLDYDRYIINGKYRCTPNLRRQSRRTRKCADLRRLKKVLIHRRHHSIAHFARLSSSGSRGRPSVRRIPLSLHSASHARSLDPRSASEERSGQHNWPCAPSSPPPPPLPLLPLLSGLESAVLGFVNLKSEEAAAAPCLNQGAWNNRPKESRCPRQ